jgi:hypothetical protein
MWMSTPLTCPPLFLNHASGVMTYVTLNTVTYILKLISFGRVVPADEDLKEYWTCKCQCHHHAAQVSSIPLVLKSPATSY